VEDLKKRARFNTEHGPHKIIPASATWRSLNLGPVAFRPTITRGLALSSMLVLVPSNIEEQFQCQKGLDA